MKKAKLESVRVYLNKELKDAEFRRMYEVECAKVALAQKIAELRDKQHLKQSDLAKKLNVSQQFVSQLERGDKANVTLETLSKVAHSLNRGIKITFSKLTKNNPAFIIA